jgi:hypothetical protein
MRVSSFRSGRNEQWQFCNNCKWPNRVESTVGVILALHCSNAVEGDKFNFHLGGGLDEDSSEDIADAREKSNQRFLRSGRKFARSTCRSDGGAWRMRRNGLVVAVWWGDRVCGRMVWMGVEPWQ